MSGFGVTPAELAALRGYVGSAADQARRSVEGLRAEAVEVLGSGWQGAAASSFRLAWEEWLAGARSVVGALDELAALVGSAGGSYAGTDDAVRAAVAGGTA